MKAVLIKQQMAENFSYYRSETLNTVGIYYLFTVFLWHGYFGHTIEQYVLL